MIFELSIKDFILIKEVNIQFDEGFNVLTGETGAGKSMILGAVNMILGGQANKESVRLGAEKAFIRGSFFTSETVNACLMRYDLPVDAEIIVISREIQAKGKSFSRINGQIVTLGQLKEITDLLISIHGQNEHQKLLETDHQLLLLDAYGGEPVNRVKELVKERFQAIQSVKKELASLQEKSVSRNKQLDFLTYQIDEIERIKPVIGEDTELEKSFEYFSHLTQIKNTLSSVTEWFSGDYESGSLSVVSHLNTQLKKIEGFENRLDQLSEKMKELYFFMEDLSKESHHLYEKLEADPEKLNQLEVRLDEINTLKLKYGQSIEEILLQLERMKTERDELEHIEALLAQKSNEFELKQKSYLESAEELTDLRHHAAESFEKVLQQELTELNMRTAQFKVSIEPAQHWFVTGKDAVEFVISTNVGQPFKPLKKVVSGGELSRIMLGVKVVLGQLDEVPTLVFDEVDAGISGVTANIVGEKLKRLSENCQILCITHLPQIAVFADHHFLIEKTEMDDSTQTEIFKLKDVDIEREISRLVGGVTMTDSTIQHAREMLKEAKNMK